MLENFQWWNKKIEIKTSNQHVRIFSLVLQFHLNETAVFFLETENQTQESILGSRDIHLSFIHSTKILVVILNYLNETKTKYDLCLHCLFSCMGYEKARPPAFSMKEIPNIHAIVAILRNIQL